MPISLVDLHKKCLFMAICALLFQGYQAQGGDTSAQHSATFTTSNSQPGFNWPYLSENLPSKEKLSSLVPSLATITSTVSSKLPALPSLDLKNTATQVGKSLTPKLDTSSWSMGNAFNYVRPSNKHIAQGLSLLILGHFLNGQQNRFFIEKRYQELIAQLAKIHNLKSLKAHNPSLVQKSETEFSTKLINLSTELNNDSTTPWPRALVADDINKSIKQLNGWIPATFGLVNQAASNRLPNFLSQSFQKLRKQLIELRNYIQRPGTGYQEEQEAFQADQRTKGKKLKAEKIELQTKKQQEKDKEKRDKELHKAQLKAIADAAKKPPPSYQDVQRQQAPR